MVIWKTYEGYATRAHCFKLLSRLVCCWTSGQSPSTDCPLESHSCCTSGFHHSHSSRSSPAGYIFCSGPSEKLRTPTGKNKSAILSMLWCHNQAFIIPRTFCTQYVLQLAFTSSVYRLFEKVHISLNSVKHKALRPF